VNDAESPERGGATPEPADTGDATQTFDAIAHDRAIREAEAAAGIPRFEGYALVVTAGPRQGAHWVLDEGTWEAGRTPSAWILLDDVTVSRRHAAFTVESGRLEMRDLGSTNGTYVNGTRADHATLQAGDEVIIGRFHLVVAGAT
jgi:pSer/pThr/pTyr-binding forkhead associated (FHA) protein